MTTDSQFAPHGSQWIEWKGGECPVAGDVRVEVKYLASGEPGFLASDYREQGLPAGEYYWAAHVTSPGNIIAYRVCAPLETGAPTDCCGGNCLMRCRPASPAATPITLCNGKPCAIAGQLDKQLADKERECADLRGKLEEAQERAANVEEAKRLTFGLLAKQLSTARQDALEEAARIVSNVSVKNEVSAWNTRNTCEYAILAAIKGEGK